MTHQLIPLADRDRWEAALHGIPHAFAHTWGSCYAMHLTSGLPTYLYAYDNGEGRVVCPLAVRSFAGHTDIVTPYGFSGFAGTGRAPEFPGEWLDFARENEFVCGYIALNPLFDAQGYYDPADLYVHDDLYVLDLRLSEEELFSRMSENRRRQVRAWEKSGAEVVLDRERLRGFIGEQLASFLEVRNAAKVYYWTPETLDALFALENVLAVGTEREGRIVAASLFSWTPYAADYLVNVSIESGKSDSAVLIWYAVTFLRTKAAGFLNLGGGIRPGDGVAVFKQRFGGASLPRAALKQIYRPSVYRELCGRVNADPEDLTGYFPPYHSR